MSNYSGIHASGLNTDSFGGEDPLFAGDLPREEEVGTLISGQNLTRGALLGKITTGGKLTLSLAASSDGSEVPYGILAHDVDASGGDKQCVLYTAGKYNTNVMTFGTGHTAASVKAGLRDKGIFLAANLGA